MTPHETRAYRLDAMLADLGPASFTPAAFAQALDDKIEALIALRDMMDENCDDEPNGDERDAAWPEQEFRPQPLVSWHEDDEDSDAGGGDVLDEPHDDQELEPNLGWAETCSQDRIDVDAWEASDGGSEGCAGDFYGHGQREARKMLAGVTRRVDSGYGRSVGERSHILADGTEFRTFIPSWNGYAFHDGPKAKVLPFRRRA